MKILDEIREAMNEDTQLVAVSKYRSMDDVNHLSKCGICDFGENRVQELVKKANERPDLNWHLIGRLQTNKVAQAVTYARLIHSLDRVNLAQALQKEASKQEKTVRVLVQVNLSKEETKAGFYREELIPFLHTMGQYPNLMIAGLMCMGPNVEDLDAVRLVFRQAKELFEEVKCTVRSPQITMKILSMGMSGDYQIALEEGSNLLRIGSLIFDDIEK